MTARPLISLDNVSKSFATRQGDLLVLDRISLEIGKREFVSFVGHSGCGKSTLLRILSGLETATEGSFTVDGMGIEDYVKTSPIGFVFQDAALMPWKTLIQNVRLPLDVLGLHAPARRTEMAQEAIELVRLTGFENHFPDQLSGGMRQRASIARSLVYRPRLLLMDAPFGALDDFTRRELSDELLRIWEESKVTVLFVTHSLPEAVLLSDRVCVLDSKPGRVQEIVSIDLPRPRTADIRASESFSAQQRHLETLIFGGHHAEVA